MVIIFPSSFKTGQCFHRGASDRCCPRAAPRPPSFGASVLNQMTRAAHEIPTLLILTSNHSQLWPGLLWMHTFQKSSPEANVLLTTERIHREHLGIYNFSQNQHAPVGLQNYGWFGSHKLHVGFYYIAQILDKNVMCSEHLPLHHLLPTAICS